MSRVISIVSGLACLQLAGWLGRISRMPLCPSQIPSVHLSPASLRPLRPGMTERGTHANAPNGRSVDQQIRNDVHLICTAHKNLLPLASSCTPVDKFSLHVLLDVFHLRSGNTPCTEQAGHSYILKHSHFSPRRPCANDSSLSFQVSSQSCPACQGLHHQAASRIHRTPLVSGAKHIERSVNFFDAQHSVATMSVQPGTNEITLATATLDHAMTSGRTAELSLTTLRPCRNQAMQGLFFEHLMQKMTLS